MSEPESDEKAQKSGSKGPDSEMFAVRPARRSIPPIREVPLTKEEIRRRILVRRASIAAVVVAALAAAYLFYRANHRARSIPREPRRSERGA